MSNSQSLSEFAEAGLFLGKPHKFLQIFRHIMQRFPDGGDVHYYKTNTFHFKICL